MDKKVSIIVPVYKVESYLPQCLDSIISQTYRDIEIILVDDGSPDKSGEICDQYATRDSRIVVIHKENAGAMAACNTGLAKASGEYIAFIDSDDYVERDYIERLVAGLVSEDIDMVCSRLIVASEEKCTKMLTNELEGVCEVNQDILSRLLYNYSGKYTPLVANSRPTKLIKTSLVREASLQCSEGIKCGEDQQFVVHCVVRAHKVNCIDYYGYYYRVNPNSVTHSYLPDLWSESKELVRVLRKANDIVNVPSWDKGANTRLIRYALLAVEQELNVQPKGYKKHIKSIIKDPVLVQAFSEYYTEGLSRYDRWMTSAIKHKSLCQIEMARWLLRVYLWLKG